MIKTLTFSALLILSACQYIQHDNIVEEIVEDVIEDKTGLEIDLTPKSEE